MGAASPIVMMLLMFAVFYFILIRPQVKKQREHQALLSKLSKGDKVVTRGGIVGKIFRATERELVLELEDKTRIRVLRSYVEGKYNAEEENDSSSDNADDKKAA